MKALRRTRIGNFQVEDAGKFINLENALEFMENDMDTLTDNEKCNFREKDKGINLEERDYENIINGVKIRTDKLNGLTNVQKQTGSDPTKLKMNNKKELMKVTKPKLNNKYGLINLYCNDEFIGIGQIEDGFLKRKIIVK